MATYEKRNWKIFVEKFGKSKKMCYLCIRKKKQTKTQQIMDTIFGTLFILFFGVISIMIFIQTNVEFWNEIGKDFWSNMKSTVINWFNNTKMGMWYKNKKNKVEILSDREYRNLMKLGRIKNTNIII